MIFALHKAMSYREMKKREGRKRNWFGRKKSYLCLLTILVPEKQTLPTRERKKGECCFVAYHSKAYK